MDESTAKAKELFRDFLNRKDLKKTKERDIILEAVFDTHDHFDAEELLILFRQKKIPVSRATIYRTLDLLVECRLVKKISFGEAHFRYEHIFGHEHHDHLICNQCGQIIEFYNKDLEELQKKICRQYDFKEQDHSLRIFGLCKSCQ